MKAEAEAVAGIERAAKDEELGYQRGCEEVMDFLRKVLMTMASNFQEDNYFEAYIHDVEERQWTEVEGATPKR